tara:strand:+ start:67413 stop:68489 length:1077 start_codon:yes stop_codon:yes gene_type:complete
MQLLWDLNECRMMPTDFKTRMQLIGFPDKMVDAVPSFDENKAVRAGAKKWRKGRGELAYEGTVAYENDDVIGVAVLELQRVSDKEVQKKQVDSWDWDKANLSWSTNPKTNEGMAMLQFIERQLKGFSSNEVTKYVIMPCLTKIRSWPMRKRGGMYMAISSDENLKLMKKVERFVQQCNSGNEFYIYTFTGVSKETKTSAERALSFSIKGQIEAAKKQIEGWKTSSRSPRNGGESLFGKLKSVSDDLKRAKEFLTLDMDDLEKLIQSTTAAAEEAIDKIASKKLELVTEPPLLTTENYEEILEVGDNEDPNAYRMRATMALMNATQETRVAIYGALEIDWEKGNLWANLQSVVEKVAQA